MIREHAFNSEWWGAPVGILEVEPFLAAPAEERTPALHDWAWVECVSTSPTPALRTALCQAGFVHADSTIQFRLDLRRVTDVPTSDEIAIRRGTQCPSLGIYEIRPFLHERFQLLRGATHERISERFVRWARDLHAETAETVLQFEAAGRPVGWFLARPRGQTLDLVLAITAPGSKLPGAALYRAACVQFARDGYRIGVAGFSVRNLDVLNIYASLGARFVAVRECWIWQPPLISNSP